MDSRMVKTETGKRGKEKGPTMAAKLAEERRGRLTLVKGSAKIDSPAVGYWLST